MSAEHQAPAWASRAAHGPPSSATASSTTSADSPTSSDSSWRDSPIGGRLDPARVVAWWIGGYVAIVAMTTLIGLAVTHALDETWIGRTDGDIAVWFEQQRTRPLDHAS